jgi:hypothetical protein
MNYTLMRIEQGDLGIDQTIEQMEMLVDAGVKDPRIRNAALQIVGGVPARDSASEIEAIFFWVKGNVRFTKDPYEIELISHPVRTLELKAGDCDDQAILISALLRSVGYNTRFKVVSAKASGKFHHVFTQVALAGSWISLDPTEENSSIGLEPLGITREKIYGGNMFENLGEMFDVPWGKTYGPGWVPNIDPSELEVYIPEDVVPIAEQKMVVREYIKDAVIQGVKNGTLSTEDIQEGILYINSGRLQIPAHIKEAVNEALETCINLYPDVSTGVSGMGAFIPILAAIVAACLGLAKAYTMIKSAGSGTVYYTPPTTYSAGGITASVSTDWSSFFTSTPGLILIGVGVIALVAMLRR